MIDSGVRGGICDSIFGLARMKNNYMESYDRNKDSSYIVYLDKNNVYGSAMSRELQVWMDQKLQKGYNDISEGENFIQFYLKYPEQLR